MNLKQAILYGAGDLRVEERVLEISELESDQVLVATEVTALSTGTELGNYLGDSTYVPGAPGYPRSIGYSNVGIVQRIGCAVRKFRLGQRVFSTKPHQSGYLAKESDLLLPVPEDVVSEEASLAYLTQLGLVALRQVDYQPGETVAVVGLGVIGLCTVSLARAIGAKVVGIAKSPERAQTALKLGAHAAFPLKNSDRREDLTGIFGEGGPDVVILTANPWPAYRLAMEIVRPRGRVGILGFPGRSQPMPDFNPLDPFWLYAKQLTVVGTGLAPTLECSAQDLRFNLRRNLSYILDLMACGELKLASVITHRLPFDQMKQAFELARRRSTDLITAVFYWNGQKFPGERG